MRLPSGDVVTYSADGTGRRVGRKVNGSWSGGWVYRNGLNVVADLDNAGAVVNRYVYGLDDQVPALLLKGTSTYRVITDQLGSVRGVVNVASGAVAQQTDYDAWGVANVVSGGSFQALGYAGGLSDATTGLVRFGARDYDPVAGRWTAKDPVGILASSFAVYSYCNGDPANSVDPSGLSPQGVGSRLATCVSSALEELYLDLTTPGLRAAQYWATQSVDPQNTLASRAAAAVLGSFAALWTPETAWKTTAVLLAAYRTRGASELDLHIDGPAERGTRIVALRNGATTLVRIDYGAYPGSNGPKLHMHIPPLTGTLHIPLQP